MATPDHFTPSEPCTCSTCVGYCRSNPGWFLPSQIPALEKHFGRKLEELVRDVVCLDWWVQDKDLPDLWIVSPRTSKTFEAFAPMAPPWDFFWTKGVCEFLKSDKCSIHALKPIECAVARHDRLHPKVNPHFAIARAWNKPRIQARLAKIALTYGRKHPYFEE